MSEILDRGVFLNCLLDQTEAPWEVEVEMIRCHDAALRLALAEATRENDTWREDVRLAAGELIGPVPEPGTDMARVCIANRLMRHERDEARKERNTLDERASELLDALDMALEKKVPDIRALRGAAFQQFWAWQEVSGHIDRGSSLFGEVEACIEEAFRLGALSLARETGGAVREAALRDEIAWLQYTTDTSPLARLERVRVLYLALSSPPRPETTSRPMTRDEADAVEQIESSMFGEGLLVPVRQMRASPIPARETGGAVREAAERLWYLLTPPRNITPDGYVFFRAEDVETVLRALSSQPRTETKAPDFIRCAPPRGECCHQRIPAVPPLEAPECNDGDDCCRYCGRGLQPCGACKPAAPPADAATEAVQRLLRAMWLYPNYSLGTRGPMGLLVDAIGYIAPDVAERLRLGTAPEHLINPSPFDATPAPAPAPSAKEGRT